MLMPVKKVKIISARPVGFMVGFSASTFLAGVSNRILPRLLFERVMSSCDSVMAEECRKRLGNQRDQGILFALGDVYQLCPAGHHMEWNLLDASSHAAPLGG